MADPFPPDEAWQPGVYFDLPEDRYHALPWLGSSDIKTLASCPPDYWFKSAMNPLREPPDNEETPAKVFGTAVHYAVLHGERAFRERYDTVDGDKGKDQISAVGLATWIEAQGSKPYKTMAENRAYIMEEWGTVLLPPKQFARILAAAKMITANPALAVCFQGGWPEVSIFWKAGEWEIPCKARIDYLRLGSNIDLKSFRRRDRNVTIHKMVMQDVFRFGYQVQAAHYLDGRVACADLVERGQVWAAGDRPDDAWLKKCFGNKRPAWGHVFFKAEGAPVALGYQDSFEGPMVEDGRSYVRAALTNYQAFTEKFGKDPWVDTAEPYNWHQDDIPKWG